MLIKNSPGLYEKISLLAGGAKFDVSCASSGVSRKNNHSNMGNTSKFGICHSWTSDGRCISLLKILFTNFCINDCAYCINRKKNDIPRTILSPEELAKVTYEFYRRNYIEGLFLSSGIINNADKTMEMMIDALKILRIKYKFNGYIHLKIIPESSQSTILEAIKWADRVSINIELPTEKSLSYLAPDKKMTSIINTMNFISKTIEDLKDDKSGYNAKGGQSTQLIIGATPESDFEILKLSSLLYKKNRLKRVYYSGYIPVNNDSRLPALSKPPLLREHRLYQADWLMRFYGFNIDEIVSPDNPYLNEKFDPKLDWALRNLDFFPVDIAKAPYEMILRVPGIGPTSAKRIIKLRKYCSFTLKDLKKLGVVIKRAKYFITINGKSYSVDKVEKNRERLRNNLSESVQYGLAL
ncbi:MAG: putative DNA modification/repair radical SAM protein [Thermodesulfovibrio sp.]|nr:putative DNA modification/repair radical SAM protein [Thermodesulfovibrio sp.]